MKSSRSKQPAEAAGSFELGAILGQRKAFGLIAGRCSAAEAAAIRSLREKRLYQAKKLSWREFCPRHLGMSRSQADHVIQLFEEFGPEFFDLTQMTRIPPEAYRAIAPSVKDGHIQWQGEAIALLPENSEKVAAAVAGLREAARPSVPALPPGAPPAEETRPPASHSEAIQSLKLRADQVVAEWSKLVAVRCSFAPPDRQSMRNMLAKTRQDLERLERQVWLTR